MLVVGRPEPGKLEHQEADGRADGLARLRERIHEQLGVQKVFVGLPGLLAEIAEALNLRGIKINREEACFFRDRTGKLYAKYDAGVKSARDWRGPIVGDGDQPMRQLGRGERPK